MPPSHPILVAVEIGKTRVFASALDWPGWTRVGRDDASALAALLACGPRYQRAIGSAKLGFHAPTDASALMVAERLAGTTTTDFGAPDVPPTIDATPLDDAALKRMKAVLNACWSALLAAAESAGDKELRKGPRGGGRDLVEVVRHVVDSNYSYLNRLNWKAKLGTSESMRATIEAVQRATADALDNAAAGNMPAAGPRGGKLWQPRYFVRRAAWHILDHAWEVEDRIEN